jgi:drug/metabolite transporter (DMT)-like permease
MTNWLLYATTVLIWGTTWFVITFQLGVVPPELSVAYRFFAAGAILLAFALARRERLALTARDHFFVALQGLTLFCANYVLFYYASFHMTTGLVAVLFSTMLWMNVANAAVFLGTPVRARTVLGGAVGFIGLCLLFRPELAAFDLSSERTGALLVSIVASYSASMGNILSARNQKAGMSVVASNGLAMTYGPMAGR